MRYVFASMGGAVSERDAIIAFIERLKVYFEVTSDAELAEKLNVGKATISAWRQRGNIPFKMQKKIYDECGLTLKDSDAHLTDKSNFSPHIAALVFLLVSERGANLSFGNKMDTAYWWSRRMTALTSVLGEELVKRCRSHYDNARMFGLQKGFFDEFRLKPEEISRAAYEIGSDVVEDKYLPLVELEALPYTR